MAYKMDRFPKCRKGLKAHNNNNNKPNSCRMLIFKPSLIGKQLED